MFSQIKARYNKFFEQTIEEHDGKNMKDIIDNEETNQEHSMIQDKKDHKKEDVNLIRRNRNKYRYRKQKKQKIKIMYANMRGIRSKMACLQGTLNEIDADVGLFCETFLTENKGLKLDGYTFFGNARTTGKGGGVGICVKNDKKSFISPHYSQRPLEIIWVSMVQPNGKPLFIGVYYGLQESVSPSKIQEEMDNLSDEICQIQNEGDMILCMDANAKIGLLGEDPSRNGKLIKKVFEECGVMVMNESEKCEGVITRQHPSKTQEKSAIDFVIATYGASEVISKLTIDEAGDLKMRSKKSESDHNTICIDICLEKNHDAQQKHCKWNTNASPEEWALFREELAKQKSAAVEIMSKKEIPLTERYKKWDKLIQKAAWKSIGKTTIKVGKPPKPSLGLQKARCERNEARRNYEKETDKATKGLLLEKYRITQENVRDEAERDEEERLQKRFESMIQQGRNGLWNVRRAHKQDKTSEWMVVKDKDGKRVYDQERNKETRASYYEDLYSKKDVPPHPSHEIIKEKVQTWSDDNDEGENDDLPTKAEIKRAIQNKKNKKATTDWTNEVLKNGGDPMVDLIYPVIKAFWEEERAFEQWNEGIITSVYKGKGDREKLENQRGITVSSSIGTIVEEIITNRLLQTIRFTQAQAGGRKGGSTTDQVFILKALIALAIKRGLDLIITFFDIKKAYDRANMDDMLHVIHEQGFTGKIWRLTMTLNKNLTARVKTKAGLSRKIMRETGGKQGGKLMVPLFAKMMDTLSEELMLRHDIGIMLAETRLCCLEYVDDVGTLAIGYDQQERTLEAVNDFAIKRQLEWGVDKCKVMEIGRHKERKTSWNLGEKTISNCETYCYLGEVISRDGRNKANLAERFKKIKGSVRAIMTSAKTGIMKRIQTNVLLRLHEAETLPKFLHNAETWTLNGEEKKEADKMLLWTWKQMLGLPTTTPTPAVIFATGSLYAVIQIHIKQLLYLHKILQKDEEQWAYESLKVLESYDTGWAKQINEVIDQWDLEKDWDKIGKKTKNEWQKEVEEAAEKANRERLKQELHTKERGVSKLKTKTQTILQTINDPDYQRKPLEIMNYGSVVITRAVIMGRYGMLSCNANFSCGNGNKICPECSVIDDESHRINYCVKYKEINLYEVDEKIDFEQIYSVDIDKVLEVAQVILKIWDLGYGKNQMRQNLN